MEKKNCILFAVIMVGHYICDDNVSRGTSTNGIYFCGTAYIYYNNKLAEKNSENQRAGIRGGG